MNKTDLALALLVVTIWGANVTVITLGLDGVPPIPLFVFALFLNLPQGLIEVVLASNGLSLFAIISLTFGAPVIGYGLWSKLLSRTRRVTLHHYLFSCRLLAFWQRELCWANNYFFGMGGKPWRDDWFNDSNIRPAPGVFHCD